MIVNVTLALSLQPCSRLAKRALPVMILMLGSVFIGTSHAQDGTGLKLGEPQPTAPSLDLGAPAQPVPEPPSPADKPSAPPAQVPAGVSREKFGSWDVACPPDGKNCAMAQIGNDASGTPVLEMVIRKLAEPLEVGDRTAIAVLDVITPLGVVLTEGLTVTIDGGRNESALFQICTEQGCLVREPIDNDLITRFKRGNSAVLSVIAANQGEVKATLSLSGFTKAYNGLK